MTVCHPIGKIGISKFLQFEGKISESIPEISDLERANCHLNSETIPDFTGAACHQKHLIPIRFRFRGNPQQTLRQSASFRVDRFSKVPHHRDEGRKIGISKFLQFEGKISESIPEISDFERVNCHANSESIPDFTGAASN